MAQKSPVQLLEVTVASLQPTLWKWQVCDRDEEIVYGYEASRETAQIRGDSALFALLAKGMPSR